MLEKFIVFTLFNKNSENFDAEECNACEEEYTTDKELANKKCRVVCDDDSIDDNMAETKPEEAEQILEKKPEEPVLKEEDKDNKPVNDDRFYWGTKYGNLGYDNRYGFGGMFYDEYPFYNRFRNNDIKIRDEIAQKKYPDRMRREEEAVKRWKLRLEDRAHSTGPYRSDFQRGGPLTGKARRSSRAIDGMIDDELPYTDYNHLPVAAGYKSHDYEYGYNFLPPERWYNKPVRPPICVAERRCPVLPTYSQGAPTDLKEFHSSRRVTPPDLINTDYITTKLNSGR